MQANVKWFAGVSAALLLAAGVWMSQKGGLSGDVAPSATESEAGAEAWRMAGQSGNSAATTSTVRSADAVRNRLFKEGSFAGTRPPSEWCVSTDLQLKACEDLRGLFEYYILGLGEVTIQEIRLLIDDEARRAYGDKLAAEIMAIFDKYWQIRTYDWKNKFIQGDRSTWLPVFEEQKTVRRQILGAEWAEAFFADDEKHFKEYYAQLESGLPPPPHPGEPVPQMEPGKDPAAVRAERVARYGEEAATRLDAVDAQWADWDRRLAAARTEWTRLQGQNNLSDTQKQDEMQRYVNTHFQDKDQLRVRALLKLR